MNERDLSLNQATTETSATKDLFAACRDVGMRQVGLWRHKYIDGDVTTTRRAADSYGLGVSSVCRGGFFTGTRGDQDADADNRRALEEAVALGAPVLVLVCGPVLDGDVAAAEAGICRGIGRLLPYARDAGVTLAIEPFHPMFASHRSAIVTLAQANDLVERFADPAVAIALDSYHVWWDPQLSRQLARAAGHVAVVQVGDWLQHTTDLLHARGLPGDGVIRLASMLCEIAAGGFEGPVEVEVLNPAIWARPCVDVVADVHARMLRLLAEATAPANSAAAGALKR